MAIFYDYIVTVKKNVSTLNKNIYLYRKNRNIDFYFIIQDAAFRFTTRQNENLVETANASYASIKILNPNGKKIMTKKAEVVDGKVHFKVTESLIDEITEVGVYVFQIDLYDDENGRVTIPPVMNALHVLEPLFDDDDVDVKEGSNEIGIAEINVAYVSEGVEIIEAFDSEGNYIKTLWVDGDIITAQRMNKIENTLEYISKNGGGVGSAPYISTSLSETVLVNLNENLDLDIDFSSSNKGKGTVKVFVNDVDVVSTKIEEGQSIVTIPFTAFIKGENRISVYVIDRTGSMSNTLTFYARYGGLEFESTFDEDSAYDLGENIRYYFTPSALDTSIALTFYIEIDGVQYKMPCTSDVRTSFTFPNSLSVGRHNCRAWISDGINSSSLKKFNLILLNDTDIVISSNTENITVEEGSQITLDYKIFKKNDTNFNTKFYIDGSLKSVGSCNLETQYYKNSSLDKGIHTIKIEAWDIANTVSDYIMWTITVTESQYEMLTCVKTGALFIASAKDRNNADENRELWQGENQDGTKIDAIMNNFSFNSDNGWIDDNLIISGDSSVEIPITPLSDNAKYGFTLDVEFMSKDIGVENAEVLSIWDDEKDIGVKITLEEAIIKSADNEKRLYFSQEENISVIFVIDRDEKTAKIYLNGVMCGGFALGDYVASGSTILEDFSTNATVHLGGNKTNGYCSIKNLRIYSIALDTNEIQNNYISNITDKTKQKEKVSFQKGETLPTLTVTGDFAGLGKDDKKVCDITFQPTDATVQGDAIILEGKYSQLQYQGTSSMQYPIKNYRMSPKDENGKKAINPFRTGVEETIFTLKADSASSGHWQNTGAAKWANDHLYAYDENDEKSMNPYKWWSIHNGGQLTDSRECINGFPCRLILVNDGITPLNEGQNEPTPGNTKDMGVFNFNNDKKNYKTFGLDTDIFPNCISFEVGSNSDTSAGAFMSYKGDGGSEGELEYLQQSFELRYPTDVSDNYGYLDMNGDSSVGLKRVIDFVDNSSNEEFVEHFEEYFNKQYTFRYLLMVMTLGMVDNLGKNMMLDSWDGKIWFPRLYDLDTICGFNNSGVITFDTDIEMEQGYWNTSSSRLWTRVLDLFHDELVKLYKSMRTNGMDYDTLMKYFYDYQIALIPESYYNKDYDIKYAPFADQYMGMANGDSYQHLKRWLKRRIQFTDSLFDYTPSYSDSITIRANTTEEMTIEIETYVPVYQHMSWYNGQMDKKKIDGKTAVTFSGKAQASTDQEVIIYGGSNIKRIRGISSMNPDSMLIGNATKLVELECNNAPLLTDINSNKANLSPNKYLTKVDISNCPQLGGTLRLNNSALLQEVNAHGTAITGMLLPTSIKNLQSLKVPKGVTELALYDAKTLTDLDLEEGYLLETLTLSNCNKLKSFDLSKVKNISLDNSYNAEELRLTINQSVDLKNMSSLKRLIYLPNNEIEEFDLTTLRNSGDYIITTFNCPNLKEFITTAPQRNSYGESDSNIYPNKLFMANKLDLGGTQFEAIKFLCTTDIFDLVLPTTVKNFYCDSAFDIDSNVITDASYEVIHNDLIQPYTEEYSENVLIPKEATIEIDTADLQLGYLGESGKINDSTWMYRTDYINVTPNSEISFEVKEKSVLEICGYDINKQFVEEYILSQIQSADNVGQHSYKLSSEVNYIIIVVNTNAGVKNKLTYTTPQAPNIVPTSANGSLLFNINTTLKTSSPYVWDLQGMKLNDFYTYGVNNKVDVSDIILKPKDIGYLRRVKGEIYANYKNGIFLHRLEYSNYVVGIISLTEGDYIVNCDLESWNMRIYGYDFETEGYQKTISLVSQNSSVVNINKNTNIFLQIPIGVTWFSLNNIKYYLNEIPIIEDLIDNTVYNIENYVTDYVDNKNSSYTLHELNSIAMPKRLTDYKVQIKNADITSTNYNTMLYPKLVDTTLPITGKVDYSKYKGTSLAWAFAFSTSDVIFNPLDSRSQGQIINDYNKLYQTDYIDIVDVWAYKDDDFSNRSTNENITKAYIELTQDNYQTKIDEVLQWYPNCTDLYLFEDGSVTSLREMFWDNNTQCGKQIQTVTFLEGYFENLTNMYSTFCQRNGLNIVSVTNIPNNVEDFSYCFEYASKLINISNIPQKTKKINDAFRNCDKLNMQLDLSKLNINKNELNYTWSNCTSLTYTPILPPNYTGSLDSTFKNTKITEAPVLPDGVTSLANTFNNCPNLTTVGNIPSKCDNYQSAFKGCPKLTSVPETGWNGNMSETFSGCTSLNQKIVINSAGNLNSTFRGMTSLAITPILPKEMNGGMQKAFYGCNKLITPPQTPEGTTTMEGSYYGSTSMTSAPNIPDSVTNIQQVLYNCPKVTEVTIPVSNITSYTNALQGTSLTNVDWTGKRATDFSLTLLNGSYTQEDLKELVNDHLEDLYKDKIKISFSDNKVTINE